jgi:hypothetical protein
MDTGAVLVSVGVLLLGLGILLYFRQRARIRASLLAEGVVIDLIQKKVRGKYILRETPQGLTLEQKTMYRPIIQFKPQRGRAVKFIANLSMRPSPYQVGDRVEVLYLPEDPKQAVINRFVHLWFFVIMLTLFGFLTLGMGWMMWALR